MQTIDAHGTIQLWIKSTAQCMWNEAKVQTSKIRNAFGKIKAIGLQQATIWQERKNGGTAETSMRISGQRVLTSSVPCMPFLSNSNPNKMHCTSRTMRRSENSFECYCIQTSKVQHCLPYQLEFKHMARQIAECVSAVLCSSMRPFSIAQQRATTHTHDDQKGIG